MAVYLYVLEVISAASGAGHKAFTALSAAGKDVLSLELLPALYDSTNRPCSHCTHI